MISQKTCSLTSTSESIKIIPKKNQPTMIRKRKKENPKSNIIRITSTTEYQNIFRRRISESVKLFLCDNKNLNIAFSVFNDAKLRNKYEVQVDLSFFNGHRMLCRSIVLRFK